jgi:hypothetical protein
MFKNEANKFFDDKVEDLGWYEFTLEELGLPPAEEILKGVKKIEEEIGLVGWRTKDNVNENYKGFGLTYNPTFHTDENIHHQVFGSKLSTQTFAQDGQEHEQLENTYYDTFGFRKRTPEVDKHLGFFLDRFNFHVSRSRVGYVFGYGLEPNDKGWHIDEPPQMLLRVNIPLQTSDEYVLEYNDKKYHLEVGKAYVWNTRVKHRPTIIKKVETRRPRINIVIGLTPWLTYVSEKDKYIQNEYFGKSIKEIVENKLFRKQEN